MSHTGSQVLFLGELPFWLKISQSVVEAPAASFEIHRSPSLRDAIRRLDNERWQALRLITDHLIPGRWAAARQPTKKEMAATAVLSLPLAEASVKIRTGMPGDEPEDYDLDVWAGVLPISVTFGEPEPDPKLREEIPLPAHIRDRVS